MTRDDIIRLIESNELTLHGDIEHFAHLVAAAEREATLERNNLTWVANCQHLVTAEREACARVCEAWGAWIGDGQLVANAIRTRVDKK